MLAPDMHIYCYSQKPELFHTPKISYGGEVLSVIESRPYAQSESGCCYYMLLDISGSLEEAYFSRMKECVLDFWQRMQPQDRLSLITFGDAVQVVFQDQRTTDDISEAVQALTNHDQTTRLFEAIHKTAELADTRENAMTRKIAVVFTDGEDFSENTSTQAEALAVLKEKRIPLYAMAAKEIYHGSENAFLDGMGEFVRDSGGIMEIFDTENALLKMQGMQELFGQAYVIQAKAKTNVIDYQMKPLSITYSNEKTDTIEYLASYYKGDAQAPNASMEKTSDCTFQVTFSEPVRYADTNSAYEIRHDGRLVTDGYMVRYEDTGDTAFAELTFQEELKNGTYEMEFSGITDDSMEENPLTDRCSLTVEDGISPGVRDYLAKYQAWIAAAVTLTVLLAAAAIFWFSVKKRKGIVTVEGKAVLQSNMERKHHVAVHKQTAPKRELQLGFDGALSGKQLTVDVVSSIVIGRSQICDVSIEDEKMSRQHCMIHDREGAFYIEDLHTTNGTMVNGKRIAALTRLGVGDKIKVGDITMTVRW